MKQWVEMNRPTRSEHWNMCLEVRRQSCRVGFLLTSFCVFQGLRSGHQTLEAGGPSPLSHLAPPLPHLESVMAEKYCLGIGNGRDWLRIMLSFRFVFLLDPTPGKTLVIFTRTVCSRYQNRSISLGQ